MGKQVCSHIDGGTVNHCNTHGEQLGDTIKIIKMPFAWQSASIIFLTDSFMPNTEELMCIVCSRERLKPTPND